MTTCTFKILYMTTCTFMTLYMTTCTFMTLYMTICTFMTLYMTTCTFMTLYMTTCTLMIISRRILLRMTNFSDKNCTKNQNTYLTVNSSYSENRAVYEIRGKNTIWPGRPQMTIWRMRFAR